MVEHIKAVGAERCILSTDFGQAINPAPTEGFRTMLAHMLKFGLSEKELEILVKVNPAKLLDLD
jgi:predicted TIM-barrel fold metal-dependent hydrolase